MWAEFRLHDETSTNALCCIRTLVVHEGHSMVAFVRRQGKELPLPVSVAALFEDQWSSWRERLLQVMELQCFAGLGNSNCGATTANDCTSKGSCGPSHALPIRSLATSGRSLGGVHVSNQMERVRRIGAAAGDDSWMAELEVCKASLTRSVTSSEGGFGQGQNARQAGPTQDLLHLRWTTRG